MRKVLVFGTALAATCIASLAVPPGATADPTPGTGPTAGASPSGSPTRSPEAPAPTPDAGAATTTAEAVQITPPPPNRRTVAYGPHARQRLDVYWRGTGTARPAVLLLHGGAWRAGSKNGWSYVAGRLTQLGYVAFAPDYRLSRHAVWPAQRDDVQAALDHIKANATRWGVDPDRVVVVGSSAGGHLATMLGTYGRGADQVRGVVALSPVNSPATAYSDGGRPGAGSSMRTVRDAVAELLGCEPVDTDPVCGALAADADVTTHVGAGDAPMLLLHSTDEFVPPKHSTVLADALTREGISAVVRTYPGRAHGAGLLADETTFLGVLDWIEAALRR